MLRVSPRFSDETLWPEFIKLDRELMSQLDAITERVISSAIHAETSDATAGDGQLALPEGS